MSRLRFSLALMCSIVVALAVGVVCARVGNTSARYASTVLGAAVLQTAGPAASLDTAHVRSSGLSGTHGASHAFPAASGESTPVP